MAGKGRKHHLTSEDIQEGSGEKVDDIKSVVELLLDNQSRKGEENRDYRAQAERREEDRLIAAEARAEARLQASKIAEEERAEARAEAKARRRLEEAKRAEELEKGRVAQQEAAGAKAYEQQVTLIRMQAEIGEKAAEAHRQEGQRARKRERAVSGIP